jgi:hypothetical protein
MKMRKYLIYFATAIFATLQTSCQKDDTLHYNNATMGNIVDGVFISDQGNRFNVVEQNCDGDLNAMKRAFVICDVLNKTVEGEDNEYDVRVNLIASVLTKDIVPNMDVTTDMMVQDPIHIENAWIAGGYINMYVMFPVKAGSQKAHIINLVHEGFITNPETEEEIPGTYRFTLRHNANDDKITPDQVVDYALAGGYVSFPLSSYILGTEAEFSIEWIWHKNVGDGLSSETDVRSLKAQYTSDGFQHSPTKVKAQVAACIE